MYLKSILIHGFKSFAEKTILEFSPPEGISGRLPLTGIVGPNGSGKSNIADAVRWVLGEQSIKAVRGKKSEDVIFAGSNRRARAAAAEVALTVINADRRIPVEEDEVVISRRLYRDGQSEYLLNNRVTRLMDIQMLLAKAAFGKEGYSVIGQGQIDAILTASPEERKAFFDEATGVRPLQIKKDQALKKLAATEENLWQAQALRDEITPRLRSLTRQVRRLERREEVERQLHDLQSQYFGALLYVMGKEQGTGNEKIIKAQEHKNLKALELRQIEQEMKALEKEESKPAELLKIQTEYEKLLAAKQKLRDQEFELRRKLLEVKKDAVAVPTEEITGVLEGIRGELQSTLITHNPQLITRTIAAISSLLSRLKGETPSKSAQTINKELEQIAADLSKIDAELERLRAQTQEFGKSAEQKKQKFFEVQKRLTAKQAEIHVLETELNLAKIEMARVETRREDLEKEAKAEMGERYEKMTNDEFRMANDVPQNLLPEIQKLKRQLELIGGVDEETAKEYQEVRSRHEFLENQIADLEGSLASLATLLEELALTIKTQFENSFEKISAEFGNYFRVLFGGGQAKLSKLMAKEETERLSDEAIKDEGVAQTFRPDGVAGESTRPSLLDKFTKRDSYRGVDITATPPGKKLKSIAMLSGGEKAMTSIALLSAILALNPPPFVILDEVDAALDESNSARFASILTEIANRTQFIVVTHNRATMQAAEVLYGITMGEDGVSKVLSLKFEEAATVVPS